MPPRESKAEPKTFVDYSHETKVSQNVALRALWFVLGLLTTGLGFLGYVLPGLPGTVFILIAVYCFARSSPKFYNWLLNNRVFGGLVRDWRAGLGIPVRAKIMAVMLITLTIGSSLLFFTESLPLRLVLVACGVGVSAYLLTRPTKA